MEGVTIVDDEPALARESAGRVTRLVTAAIAARGSACICLTGGQTPRRLYTLLADETLPWRAAIDWPRVHLFWGDERHVPPDHPDSNYGMAALALVTRVPVPPAQVHRMHGELGDPHEAAAAYDRNLRSAFAAAGRTALTFDIMLLGIGEDAHIASIFPGSELLGASGGEQREEVADGGRHGASRVAAVWAAHLEAWRITLTPAAVLDARSILVVASGAAKAPALQAAIEGPADVSRWPAQLLRRHPRVEWIIDRQAASALRAP